MATTTLELETPQAETLEDLEMGGAERADKAYEAELQKAQTLGELQSGVSLKIYEAVEGDEEGEARAEELEENLDAVAEGNEQMAIDHKLAGTNVGGYNKGFSADTAMSSDPLHAKAMAEGGEDAANIADHENSENLGHRGQIENAHDFVGKRGDIKPKILSDEGNVEDRVATVHGDRDDRPRKVYQEGVDFVRETGAEDVDSYMRKTGEHSGDHVWMQTQILKDSSLETPEMVESLHGVGFSEPEILQIVTQARGNTRKLAA